MNQVQTFKKQVIDRRDRLFKHFGVIRKYSVQKEISLEVPDSIKVDMSPHDHTISSEIDLSDEYMFLYAVELKESGVLPDGENISAEVLVSRIDDFTLELKVSHLFRQDRVIKLHGLLQGGTSLELIHLQSGAILTAWGLTRKNIPNEFFKETMAKALSFELDGRLEQGFFSYMTAIDSLIELSLGDPANFKEPREHIPNMKFKEKLSLSLKRFLDREDIEGISLISLLKQIFSKYLGYRNDIAHSTKSVVVKEDMIEDVVFLMLALLMIREKHTAELGVLRCQYGLAKKVKMRQRMPRT